MVEEYKINNIDYLCEFKFENSDGDEIFYTSSAIRGLTITDHFFNPFIGGSVSVANPYDMFEDNYVIRGDGRDRFHVKISPKDEDGELDEIFILTEEIDYGNPEVRSENIKKFSMLHMDALPFLDRIPHGIAYSGYVGDILKDIFIDLLGEEFVDDEKWESGDAFLTYYPPLTHRYIDVLNYLLKNYYAKDGELNVKGFIKKSIDKKYQLLLLSKIFKENKDYLIEAFISSDLASDASAFNENNPPPDNSPVSIYNGGIKNFAYSTPQYSWNNDFFINYVAHSYDPILGTHNMIILRLEDFKEKWDEGFVKVFKTVGGEAKPFLTINNQTKKKFRHIRTASPIAHTSKMVEGEMYNNLTFFNLNCAFSNLGDVRRNSGKFLDIVKLGETDLKSDRKMCGRWFITEIRHNFLGDGYVNEFLCCKTYTGPQSNIKDDAE